jgi:ppGpp synthetase/RelA/SpoT-type nucleotidyltranferase
MTDAVRSPEEWASAYDDLYPTYSTFTDKLEALLVDLLDSEKADYEWIYSWLLSRDDFVGRLYRGLRAAEEIHDPFKDLSDLAGVSVVVCDVSRARIVESVLEREFAIDHDASVSCADAAARNVALTDHTGAGASKYETGLYAASITEERAALPEWKPYEGLRVRLELQTVLHYAWERLDRDMPYYDEGRYPPEIRSKFRDVRALIAAADAQFDQIWPALEEAESDYAERVIAGDLDTELNGESLGAYLRASETGAALVAIGVEGGLKRDDDYRTSRTGRESTLWLLNRMGVGTLRELDDFLTAAGERAPEVLAAIAKISGDQGYVPWALVDSIIEWLALILRRMDSETVSAIGYYDELENAINTLIGNPVRSRETS